MKITVNNSEIEKLFPIDPVEGSLGKKIALAKRIGARTLLEKLNIKLIWDKK